VNVHEFRQQRELVGNRVVIRHGGSVIV
jgi:hypothetical protein